MNAFTNLLIRCLQASILLHFIATTSSVEIRCTYEYEGWGLESIGRIYECECKERVQVMERNTSVSNVTGSHLNNATNVDVQGIHIIGSSYLPKSIETFFPNLIGLSVEQHLKEITQNDLKPFPKLNHIWLARNRLEVIEKDLFKFNPELIYISLRQNFIYFIDANVFDSLNSLKILELDRNDCINENAVGLYEVSKLIKLSKENCGVERTTTTTAAPINTTRASVNIVDEKRSNEFFFWRIFGGGSMILLVLALATGMFIRRYRIGGLDYVFFRNA